MLQPPAKLLQTYKLTRIPASHQCGRRVKMPHIQVGGGTRRRGSDSTAAVTVQPGAGFQGV